MKRKSLICFLLLILVLTSCSFLSKNQTTPNKVVIEYYETYNSQEKKKVELDFSSAEDKKLLDEFKKEFLEFTKDYKNVDEYKSIMNVNINIENEIILQVRDLEELFGNKKTVINRHKKKYEYASYEITPKDSFYSSLQKILKKLNEKGN